MPRGTLTPQQLARAYRAENPSLFDDIDDATLIRALKDEDPETYALMDPLLEGAELLPGGAGAQLPGRPTGFQPAPVAPPALPTSLMPAALRIGGGLGGAVGGTVLGGPGVGTAAGGFVGGTAGEAAAQWWERNLENREAYSPGAMVFEGALSAVNPALKAPTIAGRIGRQAAFGGVLGAVGGAGRSVIEEGRLPTAGELARQGLVGAGIGGVLHSGVEAVSAGVRGLQQARRSVEGLNTTGALPEYSAVGQPPPSLEEMQLAQDTTAAIVRATQAQAQEVEAVEALRQTLQQTARQQDLKTATELKQRLEDLARLQQQRLLPPAPEGAVPTVIPPERPILVFPADAQFELVGSMAPPPSRVIGGREVGVEPPGIAEALQSSLETAYPGPPRLVSDSLVLTPPTARPAQAGLPRLPARMVTGEPQPGAQLGGRPASRVQPRLPETDRPVPLDERPYATGPNAGPRRKPSEELHGVPRKRVRYDKQPDGTTKRTVTDEGSLAEDPATYPPEVRREMARMAQELVEFPFIKGGLQEDVGSLGNRPNHPGGPAQYTPDTPSAPVYHDIKVAAGGQYANATGATLIQHLRAALLEGKGSGISDAAAEVARLRLAEEARGLPRNKQQFTRMLEPGAGDELIRWVDEAGIPSKPLRDLSPAEQAAREASDGEILGAYRIYKEGPVSPETEEFFQAAVNVAVHRGLVDPEQLALVMEGPGGSRGPSLFDFEGGPPKKPSTAEPTLPGLESVPGEERPMPPVAEAPFALTPPPSKPPAAGGPRQRSLFDRLKDESGVLILDIPEGDRLGLKRWLKANEAEHGGERWYARAEQAMEDGDWAAAWKHAAGASVRSVMAARAAATTPEQEQMLEQLLRGTPFQEDFSTQIITQARARAQVGTAPPVKNFPPSPHVTQAGAARGKATLGPAGILNPGPRRRPLSSIAPETRAATLDKTVVRLLLESVTSDEDLAGMALVPGNQDTMLRFFRQFGDQLYQGKNLKLLREAGVDITPQEIAQHWNATVSDAGRILNLLRTFIKTHEEELYEAARRQDIGGALAGTLGRGGREPVYVGKGRGVLSPAGQQATQELIEQIARTTTEAQAAALSRDLQQPRSTSAARAVHDSSYPFMLATWKNAVRNYTVFVGRYSIDSLNHAMSAGYARLLRDPQGAAEYWAQFRTRGLTPFRRGAGAPFGKDTKALALRSWQEDLQGIFDIQTDFLNRLPVSDVRRSIGMLLDFPTQAAHFLGAIGGEDLSKDFVDRPILKYLTNPKVHRYLTQFARAAEFSGRASVFDASVRAQLRLKGLDPARVLGQRTPEIIRAVGGQEAFDRLLFTATSHALEATFAGTLAKNSMPGHLVQAMNKVWPVKLGFSFPKFNFALAPRWIYDHSPVALLDWIRFPLDRAGVTAAAGTASGGRLYRGQRALEIQRTELPALAGKIADAESRQGAAMAELLGTQEEFRVRNRQVKHYTTKLEALRAGLAPELPEAAGRVKAVEDKLAQVQEARQQLVRRRDRLKTTLRTEATLVKEHRAEQRTLLDRVDDAIGISAPTYAQSLARMTTGAALLGAAIVMRSQPWAEGTKWHQWKVPNPLGGEDLLIDLRSYSPMIQALYVGDVLRDFYYQTDWAKVREEMGDREWLGETGKGAALGAAVGALGGLPGIGIGATAGGLGAGAIQWADAMWRNYEGKYTEEELGAQFAQAFLSISRAAGTSMTLADLATQNGFPSMGEFGRALVGTIGQFFGRYTMPAQNLEAVPGLSSAFPEEAKVRTPPKFTPEEWTRPLAGPMANIPGVKELIPERVSQTTGRPVETSLPALRGLAGVGTSTQDFISAEAERIGLPGSTRFIAETGDVGLDRAIAESYSRLQQRHLPMILQSQTYQRLRTPARQRDFLQRYVYPLLKRAALDEARRTVGTSAYQAATVKGEDARRQVRQRRMLEELEGAAGPVEELPGETPEIPEVPARPF